MSQRKRNEKLLEQIKELFLQFKSKGDADHDGLMVVHVQDTPKGAPDSKTTHFFQGCTCHFYTMLINLAAGDPDSVDGILEAADVIRAKHNRQSQHN